MGTSFPRNDVIMVSCNVGVPVNSSVLAYFDEVATEWVEVSEAVACSHEIDSHSDLDAHVVSVLA